MPLHKQPTGLPATVTLARIQAGIDMKVKTGGKEKKAEGGRKRGNFKCLKYGIRWLHLS